MEGRDVLHFRIIERIGAGGMGVVYRAEDTRLGRQVALKFLPGHAPSSPIDRQRLLAEARAAAALDHPNVGAIYDIGSDGETPFIVMALYEGENLRSVLQRGPLVPEAALKIAIQATRGVAAAHERGVVHRDLKPENLFLTSRGELRVLDFGLARVDGFDGLTRTGAVVGTLAYMSPEQVRGLPVDPRADIWALGVILYEMLTGFPPFDPRDGPAACILSIIRDDPKPLGLQPHFVHDLLPSILARTLSKDADQRYQRASELLDDLERVALNGEIREWESSSGHNRPPLPLASEGSRSPEVSKGSAPPAAAKVRLPHPTAKLVGRAEELEIIRLHLEDPTCRILTLLGPGGSGKTRLALEAAQQQTESGSYTGGVWFVELEAVEDPAHLPARLVAALELGPGPQADPIQQLVDYLADRRTLLVLDNFEQLIDAAVIVSRLASECPGLRFLVTSRERLALGGEWVLPILGLPVAQGSEPSRARACDAVRLFEECARRGDTHYVLEDDELPHVIDICRSVDGSPLALELAAAWVRAVDCREIAAAVRGNLDFLSGNGRDASGRHASVRASFEYSWRLLSDPQKSALAALSIFRASFDHQAASEVAGVTLQLMRELVDKSLLVALASRRFRMHPLIQGYAREKLLHDPEEAGRLEAAHAAWYHRVLQTSHEPLRGKEQAQVRQRLEAEFDNLVAAWDWSVRERRTVDLTTSGRVLDLFLDSSGRSREALELFERAADSLDVADGAHRSAVAELLSNASFAAFRLGKYDDAREHAREGLELAKGLPFQRSVFSALNTLGAVALHTGDLEGAKRNWQELRELAREHGGPKETAVILGNLGTLEYALGNYEADRGYQEEALSIYRRLGQTDGVVSSLGNLAHLLGTIGEAEEGQRRVDEALSLAQSEGLRLYLPRLLGIAGDLLAQRDRPEEAAARFGQVLELAQEQGDRGLEASIRQNLGRLALARGNATEAGWQYGRSLSIRMELGLLPAVLGCLIDVAELWLTCDRHGDARMLLELVSVHPFTEPPVREHAGEVLAQKVGSPHEASAGLAGAMKGEQELTLDRVVSLLLAELDEGQRSGATA